MGRISAFLHAPACATVPNMFRRKSARIAQTKAAATGLVRCGKDHADWDENSDNRLNYNIKSPNADATLTCVWRQLRSLGATLSGALLLTACGFNGTDPDEGGEEAAPSVAATVGQPNEDRFTEVTLADSEPRPTMQLQVVLDRYGFGPGIIAGREGLS